MTGITDPAQYEGWYHTRRGSWIADREFALLMKLMRPQPGATLLDVGSGTGYFTRRFAESGLRPTGLDPDQSMNRYARTRPGAVNYVEGTAERLPFKSQSFDFSIAVTSLCFVADPLEALAELWRVCRHGVALGLLNRNSLLYRQKHHRGGYAGARWDDWSQVRIWLKHILPGPVLVTHRTAIFLPSGGGYARSLERGLPGVFPWGGFLAVYMAKGVQGAVMPQLENTSDCDGKPDSGSSDSREYRRLPMAIGRV
ncbi:MAG: class I SAM-dependent methyltransferase [Pseudomonadota bacterium]|nr:MAG: class I SAM-dependent methyltransferase [Pseudomonadota bacterium]